MYVASMQALTRYSQQHKNQPIWGNRFIKLKKETLLFKSWVKDGIIAMNEFISYTTNGWSVLLRRNIVNRTLVQSNW